MTWLILLAYLFIAFNTIKYAFKIWRSGNKLAGVFISMLSLSLAGLPFYVLFK